MNIIVLNGSPKGDNSVTIKYIEYLKKKFDGHNFKCINISAGINQIENDMIFFNNIIDEINSADLILWSFPVYYMLIPGQYKRFIELIFENNATHAFAGKYSASISTSINFFDQTAHNYINGISDDLNMFFIDFISFKMFDLLNSEMRNLLDSFFSNIEKHLEVQPPTVKKFNKVVESDFSYAPAENSWQINSLDKNILILTDSTDENSNLSKMNNKFMDIPGGSGSIRLFNINDINISGGCTGCLKCSYDNQCSYMGKDGFIDFYNKFVKSAHIIIFSGVIKNRFLSARWKTFIDRSFFNTHIPVLQGKQFIFALSGPLNQINELKSFIDGFSETAQANLVDIISDDVADSGTLDMLIRNCLAKAVRFSTSGYVRPATFYGVSGSKIFRDFVWSNHRFVFHSDYKYYKKHKLFNFPVRKFKTMLTDIMMLALFKVPSIKKNIQKELPIRMTSSLSNFLRTV